MRTLVRSSLLIALVTVVVCSAPLGSASTVATPAVMTLRRMDGTAVRELGTERTPAMQYPNSRHGFQATQRPHDHRSSHDYWMRVLLGK